MKLIGIREAKQGLSEIVAQAQKERVLLTKHGRPMALVIGVEGQDLETIMLAADQSFWRWIEARRAQGATMTLHDIEERYATAKPVRARTRKPGARSRGATRNK